MNRQLNPIVWVKLSSVSEANGLSAVGLVAWVEARRERCRAMKLEVVWAKLEKLVTLIREVNVIKVEE